MNQEVQRISQENVKAALKRMKSGKAAGPDDKPREGWIYLGDRAEGFLNQMV